MKNSFSSLLLLFPLFLFAQQNLPVTFHKYEVSKTFDKKNYEEDFKSLFKIDSIKEIVESDQFKKIIMRKYMRDTLQKRDSNHFKLFGVGNLNDETLKNLNAGGKLAIGFTPNPNSDKMHANYFASFNKNATNTDSAISTMLVFPEAGNHTAFLSVLWQQEKILDQERDLVYQHGPFLEFAFKKITNKKDTTDPKFQELAINTLHYTGGYRLGYSKIKSIEGKLYQIGGYLSVFASYVNIPDEDHRNFETITKLKATSNSFFMLGAKVSFELNGFQIFADIRHVFGDEKKLPIKDLKGFNSNIGVAFNTEIFRF
jgi:hypothetical protein